MADRDFSLTDSDDPNNPQEKEIYSFSREHVYEPVVKELLKGDKELFDGKFLEAALIYSEEIGANGCNGRLFYNRAKCLMELNYVDLAIKDIEKAINLDPNEITFRYRLLDCYLRMADTDKAEEILSAIGEKFTKYGIAVKLKTSKINKIKSFKNHIFQSSVKANEKFLRYLNSKMLKIAPACPDFKFLKMRTLLILNKSNEIDASLNDSEMLGALVAYYNGDIGKSMQLITSMPVKQAQAVENFKMQVKAFEEIKTADTLAHSNNFGASLKLLKKLCTVDPSNKELNRTILLRMAQLNCQLKKPEDALSFVSKVLEIDPKCLVAASIQAECLFQNYILVEAVAKCDEILTFVTVPDLVKENVIKTKEKALESIGKLKASQRDTETKENTAYSNNEENESERIKFYIQQTRSFIDQKDFERALEEAKKAVKIGLQYCISVPETTICFLSLGMIEEVTVLNRTQNDENILAALATLNDCNTMMSTMDINRADDLLKIVENAQTFAPACINYRNSKVKYLIKLGRYIEAEKIICEVLKMYPKHYEMTFNQCLNYYHQGEMEHLTEGLKEIISISSNDQEASKFIWHANDIIKKHEKGTSLFQNKNFNGAYCVFNDIAGIYQQQSKYRQLVMYNIGSCCVEMKKFEEAIGFFDESLLIDEAHVKSLKKRAMSLYHCERFEDCIIDCNELHRICPSEETSKLRHKANSARTKRGELSIHTFLEVCDKCEADEMEAAFEKYLEKYDPVRRPHPNKLKSYQLTWRYDFVKTKFDLFKSNQNLAMDESL